ncbi:MAG: hypothetical protein LWW94_06815, partial [Candidatus Desulfofervidaceae bacterium]|nr:hypothetical protein [Candidatus Desulfofervidaceae bacterium]
ILSLPNLFPSLARRFACCQSCSVSLRPLWAYGFDSASPRAPEKLRLVKVNLEVSSQLEFSLKINCGLRIYSST